MVTTYTLRGKRFDLIPSDALGIQAAVNDDPLHYRNSVSGNYLCDIVTKTETEMVLQLRTPGNAPANRFLGGILSADRATEYWVNNTNPLP